MLEHSDDEVGLHLFSSRPPIWEVGAISIESMLIPVGEKVFTPILLGVPKSGCVSILDFIFFSPSKECPCVCRMNLRGKENGKNIS